MRWLSVGDSGKPTLFVIASSSRRSLLSTSTRWALVRGTRLLNIHVRTVAFGRSSQWARSDTVIRPACWHHASRAERSDTLRCSRLVGERACERRGRARVRCSTWGHAVLWLAGRSGIWRRGRSLLRLTTEIALLPRRCLLRLLLAREVWNVQAVPLRRRVRRVWRNPEATALGHLPGLLERRVCRRRLWCR